MRITESPVISISERFLAPLEMTDWTVFVQTLRGNFLREGDFMINTLKIYHELSETMGEQSAKKLAEVIGAMYEDLLNTVTKKDFDGLKDIVKDLVDVQKRTEVKVEELAEAQKRTEVKVGELAGGAEADGSQGGGACGGAKRNTEGSWQT